MRVLKLTSRDGKAIKITVNSHSEMLTVIRRMAVGVNKHGGKYCEGDYVHWEIERDNNEEVVN